MPTHVALLRGINVGGRNRVAMADLRQVVGATLFLHTPLAWPGGRPKGDGWSSRPGGSAG